MSDLSQLSDDELTRMFLAASQQPAAKTPVQADPDAALSGTLQLGIPFTNARLDTHIPLPAAIESALVAGGKSASRILQGIQQPFASDNPSNLSDLVTGQTPASRLRAQVAEEDKFYAPLAQQHPYATGFGESLPAFAIPLGSAASIPAAIARAAGANALPGALEYGSAEDRAKRAGIGAAGGALGAGAGYAIGRVINPIRGANPLATDETRALADSAGITLTPAQATGSKVLSSLDGTLATYPGSAGVMAKIQQAQRGGFNNAAMTMLGEQPTTSIANDAAQIAKQNIGGRIEQASAGTQIPVDDTLLNNLAAVETKYGKNLTPDQKPIVKQYMDDILNQAPTIDGAAYQTWRSRIGARAAGTSDSELKGALKGIQGALDDAFDRSAGPDASAAMQEARNQYRNFKTLEPLINKAAMSSSNIPPAQVMSRALATKNTTGTMQNLAQLGQAIGNEYPNSGTAPRLFWQAVFNNPLHLVNPLMMTGAPVAWALAHAVHSAPGRAYLTNEAVSPFVEEMLMRGGGLLGAAGAGAAASAGLLR